MQCSKINARYLYALIDFREQDYFLVEYSYCIRAIGSERAWWAAASCTHVCLTLPRVCDSVEIKTRVGKWQTVNCRFLLLKIDDKYTRIVQNNSRVHG